MGGETDGGTASCLNTLELAEAQGVPKTQRRSDTKLLQLDTRTSMMNVARFLVGDVLNQASSITPGFFGRVLIGIN